MPLACAKTCKMARDNIGLSYNNSEEPYQYVDDELSSMMKCRSIDRQCCASQLLRQNVWGCSLGASSLQTKQSVMFFGLSQ